LRFLALLLGDFMALRAEALDWSGAKLKGNIVSAQFKASNLSNATTIPACDVSVMVLSLL
jgi:hypothetical protein